MLATACFVRNGCLITPDATAIHGRDRIRPVLAQLILRRTEITVEGSTTVSGGDVAMAYERWRISTGVGEAQYTRTIYPTLILRRIEAAWKVAIAAPWGWAGGRMQ